MPKGLHALAEVSYRPDEQLLAECLALIPHQGPRTFFADIARVEPGHVVAVTRDGIATRKYWQPQRRTAPAYVPATISRDCAITWIKQRNRGCGAPMERWPRT
jgi:asparagine synthetase B (glutamine-hydrolysing)